VLPPMKAPRLLWGLASSSVQRQAPPCACLHLAICVTRDAARASTDSGSASSQSSSAPADPDAASPDRLAIGVADRALCCGKPGAHEFAR
jgi:hypothetical protein